MLLLVELLIAGHVGWNPHKPLVIQLTIQYRLIVEVFSLISVKKRISTQYKLSSVNEIKGWDTHCDFELATGDLWQITDN